MVRRFRVLSLASLFVLLGGACYAQNNAACYADQQAGNDMGEKINACIGSELLRNGGTIDARGLTGDQSSASTIKVSKNVEILLGAVKLALGPSSQGFVQLSGSNLSVVGDLGGQSIIHIPSDWISNGAIQNTSGGRNAASGPETEIESVSFEGSGSTKASSTGAAVYAIGASRIRIRNCKFSGLSSFALNAQNSEDVQFIDNDFSGNATDAVSFIAIRHGDISHNSFHDPNQTSTFIAVLILNPYDPHYVYHNEEIVIANNEFADWTNGEIICVHDGKTVAIDNNTAYDVFDGIGLSLFNITKDLLQNISITGNVIVGTTRGTGVGSTGQIGVDISGGDSLDRSVYAARDISVTGNVVRNMNATAATQKPNYGCYVVGYSTNVVFSGNTASDCYSYGYAVSTSSLDVLLTGNTAYNIRPVSGQAYGFWVPNTTADTIAGRIADNYVDTVGTGVRLDSSQPRMLIGTNHVTNFTDSKVAGSGKTTTE